VGGVSWFTHINKVLDLRLGQRPVAVTFQPPLSSAEGGGGGACGDEGSGRARGDEGSGRVRPSKLDPDRVVATLISLC
jgi:hypothetical protein